MGPKRLDIANKNRQSSQSTLNIPPSEPESNSQYVLENQPSIGKFASDLEACCRDPLLPYPIQIPVLIRSSASGLPNLPSQSQIQTAVQGGTSATPSLVNGVSEEVVTQLTKRSARTRTSSISQSIALNGANPIEGDARSVSTAGQDLSKGSNSMYRTFHTIRDSDFFRPKVLVDSATGENDPIEQINGLYMKGWLLDQRFIEILKKILPFQENLHTLNFSYVGINAVTIHGLIELTQIIKNLKTVILDGNSAAADYFHHLIRKEDSKIVHLSLRFCNLTDTNADHLATALGNISTQNRKLLTLSLSGNRIGDNGAKCFATALRFNRTLISLNLSSNFITDKGGCALALVLREIILTEEEVIRRRYMLSRFRSGDIREDSKHHGISPATSTASILSRSGRETRSYDSKHSLDASKRKSRSTKEKRQRNDSSDENRSTSHNKTEQKKNKMENIVSRTASSIVSRRSGSDNLKSSGNTREKRIASASTKKNTHPNSGSKDSDSDKVIPLVNIVLENENPLISLNEHRTRNGEICLQGNLSLITLNLSRNFMTLKSVDEFLRSVQHQMTTNGPDSSRKSISSTGTDLNLDFSGLCRLELKGMKSISTDSPSYQTLESILQQKNPSTRFLQVKEREMKASAEQSQPNPTVPPINIEKPGRPTNPRPSARSKD